MFGRLMHDDDKSHAAIGRKNSSNASKPPADAPKPTIGNFGTWSDVLALADLDIFVDLDFLVVLVFDLLVFDLGLRFAETSD